MEMARYRILNIDEASRIILANKMARRIGRVEKIPCVTATMRIGSAVVSGCFDGS
jgi:hypothetical protein